MIEVCKEEKMAEILGRYKAYNNHAESYTWKYHCNPLNMEQTLGNHFYHKFFIKNRPISKIGLFQKFLV